MARGTSISITSVVINGPMVERCFPSWETDNAVIVKENKTTHSSTWGPYDLREICISIGAFTRADLLCKVAMMQQRRIATACHSHGLWRENVARLAFVKTFDTRAVPSRPLARPNETINYRQFEYSDIQQLKYPAQKRRSTLNCS